MGLGPSVCQHCRVMSHYTKERGWHCQYCGETELTAHAGFDLKYIQQLEENEKEVKRFYNFWRKNKMS